MTNRKSSTGTGRGRPATSHTVRIIPIPREHPDARKLGRAFLALALHQAAQVKGTDEEGAGDESA